MERQINIYWNIYTYLQIYGPRYKKFIPIFKSFVPSFKSFIPRYKSFVLIFKYGWHGNIHYFMVDGGELNLCLIVTVHQFFCILHKV